MLLAPFRRSASLRGGKKGSGESPETGQDGLTSAGMGRAEPKARAHFSTATEQDDMKAFRPKRFKPEADIASRDGAGLSDEQRKTMMAEFTRRITGFAMKWRRCGNRHCQR